LLKRTRLYLVCLLIAGCAAVPTGRHLVPVGVISTERALQYPTNVDPTFAASQRRLSVTYDQAIANATERLLNDVRLPVDQRCDVALVLVPSGLVIRVEPGQCSLSPSDLKVVSDALVDKSLPYRGYESVFQRRAHLAFCSPGGTCTALPIKTN